MNARPPTPASKCNLIPVIATVLTAVLSGCGAADQLEPMTAETIRARVSHLEQNVSELSDRAADGALHALSSADPEMRAQAALAFAKTGRAAPAALNRLEELALHDEDPVVQAAGLTAICRIDTSDRASRILRQLADDPQLRLVAGSLERQ